MTRLPQALGGGATVPPDAGGAAAGACLALGTTLGSTGVALPWIAAIICGVAILSSGR